MNPSPTQVSKWRKVSEWRKEAKREWDENGYANWAHKDEFSNFFLGYLRARTEQATEIAALEAHVAGAEAEVALLKQGLHRANEKIAELMPLAKFGAMVFKSSSFENMIEVYRKSGLIDADDNLSPNIEAAIEQILKD